MYGNLQKAHAHPGIPKQRKWRIFSGGRVGGGNPKHI